MRLRRSPACSRPKRAPADRTSRASSRSSSNWSAAAASPISSQTLRAARGAACNMRRRRAVKPLSASEADDRFTQRWTPSMAMASSASASARSSAAGVRRVRTASGNQCAATSKPPAGSSCMRSGHSRWINRCCRSTTGKLASRTRPCASVSLTRACHSCSPRPAHSLASALPATTANGPALSAPASARSAWPSSSATGAPWRISTAPAATDTRPAKVGSAACSRPTTARAVSCDMPPVGSTSAKSAPLSRPTKAPFTRSV